MKKFYEPIMKRRGITSSGQKIVIVIFSRGQKREFLKGDNLAPLVKNSRGMNEAQQLAAYVFMSKNEIFT